MISHDEDLLLVGKAVTFDHSYNTKAANWAMLRASSSLLNTLQGGGLKVGKHSSSTWVQLGSAPFAQLLRHSNHKRLPPEPYPNGDMGTKYGGISIAIVSAVERTTEYEEYPDWTSKEFRNLHRELTNRMKI